MKRNLTVGTVILLCVFAQLSLKGNQAAASAPKTEPPGIPQIRLADIPGPRLIKLPRKPHQGASQWQLDLEKRLGDARKAEGGGDSEFVCSYPECSCHIYSHSFLCRSVMFMDCHLHVFQFCKYVEIIN